MSCEKMGDYSDPKQELNANELYESSEEKSKESIEKEIEENVRTDRFLRTNDSDEESDSALESMDKTGCNSDAKQIKDHKQFNECQRSDRKTGPKETTVISSNSTGDSLSKTQINSNKSKTKPKIQKNLKFFAITPKWGEWVGITDAYGRQKRIVSLDEIKNYIPLRMRYNGFKYYFSLIDGRFPTLYQCFDTGEQRWRMRYNIFVEGLFDAIKRFDTILHVGEIIIYFDLRRDMSLPFYVNCSFYANYCPLKADVDTSQLTRMIVRLHDILTSSLILQLKFPIAAKMFRNTNSILDKFLGHQKELMRELDFIKFKKQLIPNGRVLSIETNRVIAQNNGPDKRPVPQKRREIVNRSTNTRIGEQRARPSGGDNRSKKEESERVDRLFFNSNTRRSNRSANRRNRLMEYCKQPLNENTEQNMNERNESKNLFKKSYQRRNRNVDRMDANNESDERSVNAFRSGAKGERRSRQKTRRR